MTNSAASAARTSCFMRPSVAHRATPVARHQKERNALRNADHGGARDLVVPRLAAGVERRSR